ncbi:hypothetical protein [Aeromicrobium fastidiosum]|uniref:Uncharacterized protein n=1 Tax=Aeromicrobium fastidiosum TaxID=52699 RepID=A0A641APV6_9ACTN|nr:hypothetical protein [Aeromicrobium fastidiosum]KAA1380120.1 hypothetical protein ESP62_002650 [Aeromicrobium fastidiosum]MBP2389654.1 hypothetical protein [Aeromicrobium fastidiosum]
MSDHPGEDASQRWRENVDRRGVDADTVAEIVRLHGVGPDDLAVLDGLDEIVDPAGASFFLLPCDASADDVRRAVIMTYVVNAGTGYGASGPVTDFAATPYSAGEAQRIVDRQRRNAWSYSLVVPFVHRNGGRLVTTPNGMLMGLGGNRLLGLFSQRGGTTYGDVFVLNIGRGIDPVAELRAVVLSGRSRHQREDGTTFAGSVDLVRLMHHEERHSQQWAAEGPARFVASYLWEQVRGRNDTEEDAGLSDGGYR